ncbi:MAG: S49 family peptidase [Alphaproteobacteria bacterium]|nr:MAG: S49 family peptidase [Alphaproteobacteria bacterium]
MFRHRLSFLPFDYFQNPPALVAVVPLTGAITPQAKFGRGINLALVEPSLEQAFSLPGVKAVALAINSPGGSPVQAALIARRIRDLAAEKKVPVYAFCEDVAASGGYMLALAADEIFVHPASIVGSIGVVYAGFGFVGALEKLGVERRLYTAGEKKAMLDPFSPEKEADVKRLAALQKDIHQYFQDMVTQARGDRLKGTKRKLFSGDVWTGTEAVDLGLADGLGELRSTLKERFGDKTKFKLISRGGGWLKDKLGLDVRSRLAEEAVEALEQRLSWSRFGL